MIFSKRGQRGFTLMEVILALAVTGLIGAGATMATLQVMNQSAHNSDYTTASRNAMDAIYWISRDALMSQVVVTDGAAGFPLTLSWTEWDNSVHQIIYSVEDGELKRDASINGDDLNETVVAEYINSTSANTTCNFDGGVLTLQVTATVGDGAHALSVARTREIVPRPEL